MRRIDLTGRRFAMLLATGDFEHRPIGRNGRMRIYWRCVCDCGRATWVDGGNLRSEAQRSCGCLTGERHGMVGHPLYRTWTCMKARCLNPDDDAYPDYGGRGISVCDRWARSFSAFVSDMGERPAGRSLDRINNDGNYERGNCRWATRIQQRHNSRRKKTSPSPETERLIVSLYGVRSSPKISTDLGIPPTTIRGIWRRYGLCRRAA